MCPHIFVGLGNDADGSETILALLNAFNDADGTDAFLRCGSIEWAQLCVDGVVDRVRDHVACLLVIACLGELHVRGKAVAHGPFTNGVYPVSNVGASFAMGAMEFLLVKDANELSDELMVVHSGDSGNAFMLFGQFFGSLSSFGLLGLGLFIFGSLSCVVRLGLDVFNDITPDGLLVCSGALLGGFGNLQLSSKLSSDEFIGLGIHGHSWKAWSGCEYYLLVTS